jgi:hypothetical protein
MKKRTKICIIKKNIVPLRRLYQTVRNLQRFRTLNQLISVLFFTISDYVGFYLLNYQPHMP